MNKKLVSLVAAGAGAAGLLLAGMPAAPAAETAVVSKAKPTYEWTVEGITMVNPWANVTSEAGAPGNCFSEAEEATFCDVRIIQFEGAPATTEIKIEWDSPTDDYDLYVYDAKGNEIGHSYLGAIDGLPTSEQVKLNLKAGTYRVESVYFLSANSTLRGSVKVK